MPIESSFESVKKELNPQDFADAFYDTAVRQPCDAIRQLWGEAVPQREQRCETLAAQAGNMAGAIFDMVLLSKATGHAADRYLGTASAGVFGHTVKMGLAGSIYGGVLTPSSSDRGLLTGRLENAALHGATFATMGGIGKALESSKVYGSHEFMARVSSNALSGAASGIVDAYGRAGLIEHRLASRNEVIDHARHYIIFGAGFGALDYGLTAGAKKAWSNESLQSNYYRLKWSVQDGTVEAKRQTYALLNRLDLRHPLQRVGDLVYGTEVPGTPPRPILTAENHPITAFERELPRYISEIAEKEQALAGTSDWTQKRAIYDQEKETGAQFLLRTLQLWHGSPEQPGIRMFSDAELTTATTSAERVGQIRRALMQSNSDGGLTSAVLDLVPQKIGDPRAYDLRCGMPLAKERFYGYDEMALAKRMQMPGIIHSIDHHGLMPLNWMPFEPTAELPNLFHGTVSTSLPSIFRERAMLPASELRLRGIAQETGECAGQQYPRRSISLTRDFNEAWAYHRHSPDSLNSYPVVIGVSRDVVPRLRPAGLLEPGELLTQKLRLGENLLTRLGLRKPEITHLFVPDSEISSVNGLLARYRVSGVKVVGLGELKTPDWKIPSEEQLRALE